MTAARNPSLASTDSSPGSGDVHRRRRRALVIAAIAGALALGLVLWSVRLVDHQADQHRRVSRSIAQARVSLSLAHLRFEEAVAGDKSIDLTGQVYEEIDEAHRLARAMLNGGDTQFGVLEPVASDTQRIARMADRISAWRRLTELRWSERTSTQAGSESDQAYDSAFEQILQISSQLEAALHNRIEAAEERLLVVHAVLVAVFVLVVLWGARSVLETNREDRERTARLEQRVAERTQALSRSSEERERQHVELQRKNDEMQRGVHALERRSREIAVLGELAQLLPSSTSTRDAFAVCAQLCARVFPDAAGFVALATDAGMVEPAGAWGTARTSEPFAADRCWALRRGRAHVMGGAGSVRCAHLDAGDIAADDDACLCVPVMARGEALGLLHVKLPAGSVHEDRVRLATTVTEHVALALENVRLRDALRTQALRDPRTGLFNRRFMEEALQREVRSATRKQRSVGVIALDVDGLEVDAAANDEVLRDVAAFVGASLRAEDLAGRGGPSLLLLVLADSALEDTARRAAQICTSLRALALRSGKRTASAGVAAFPANGDSTEALIRSAELAAARAREGGGDRVVTAS